MSPHPALETTRDPSFTRIEYLYPAEWPDYQKTLDDAAKSLIAATGFEPKAGAHLIVPATSQAPARVIVIGDTSPFKDALLLGKLPAILPQGGYELSRLPRDPQLAVLGWCLGAYSFGRYNQKKPSSARLYPPPEVDVQAISEMAQAVAHGRDLVNTPANDLGPEEMEQAARDLAACHGAQITVISGRELEQGFPLVHAVGKGSPRAPRLMDMRWGEEKAPRVTLVGKGVVFDTGGLNIKPDASMLLMKKDMGGAAIALTLARLVMQAELPVRLRMIVAAVENSVSGAAFRPGDVYPSRKGMSVEIGNTDAEGRLILADALALADEEKPDLLIDFATLTGAARVALGPDLPALFTPDEGLARDVVQAGERVADPLWRLPLWEPYETMLESKIANTNNISGGPFAGAITAALFLKKFVERTPAWAHIDAYCWMPSTRPGRPEGGEVQTARAVFEFLRHRFPPLST